MSEMHVLNRSGDTKLIWNSENEDEVANAKKTFDDLRSKNFGAYSVKKKGKRGKIIRQFDPSAEKIILVPPVVGG